METGRKEGWERIILLVIMGIFVALTLFVDRGYSYSTGEEEQKITYVKGKVVSIEQEELSADAYNAEGYTGKQFLKIKLLSGEEKGQEVEVTNYLSTTYYVYAKQGQRLLLSREEGTDGEIYYMVYQYYRCDWLYLLAILFGVLVIVVGKKKGVNTLISLGFDFYTLFFFTLPWIYHGHSPVGISIVTVILITGTTLLLLNGFSKKTLSAVISTAAGVLGAGVIFGLFSGLTHITGYSSPEADAILVLSHTFGLQIKYVLFAGILIASLGAVMDVGMSVSSALYEMKLLNPKINRKELFLAGIHVGRDMIGTMTNTLVLAFAGGAFVTMITYAAYNMEWNQLLCNDYIVIELLQGLSGTMAVVLTVPIGSLVSSWLLMGEGKETYETKKEKCQ